MQAEIVVLKSLDDVFKKAIELLRSGYVAVVVSRESWFNGCREAFLDNACEEPGDCVVLMARLGLKNPLVEFVVERETAVVMVKKSRLSSITSKPTNGVVFGIRSESGQCLFGEFEIQGSAEEVLKMIVDESKEYVQRLKAREVSSRQSTGIYS
jgi:hypothetical protein